MALVALASIKGAPGVTTAMLALGAAWPPNRPVITAEVDPAGGDVAARCGLAAEPSAVTLAAALRREQGGTQAGLGAHCQQLPGGLRVLAGSPAPAEMCAAIDEVAPALTALATAAAVDVLADCGRLELANLTSQPGSPVVAPAGVGSLSRLLGRADLVVVLTRTELADLSHVEASLPTLRSLNENLVLCLVGDLRWRPEEISSELGAEVIGQVPYDPAGAAAVGGHRRAGSVRRLPLLRAARPVADRMVERLPRLVEDEASAARPVAELQGVVAIGEVAP